MDQIYAMYPVQTGCDHLLHGLGNAQKSRAFGHAAGEQIRYGQRLPGIKGRALGHIADSRFMAALAGLGKSDDAGIGPLAQNGLQKGAFACAVGADKGNHFSAMDVQIHVLQNLAAADGDGQIFHPQAAGVAAVLIMQFAHPNASLMVSMLRYMASK